MGTEPHVDAQTWHGEAQRPITEEDVGFIYFLFSSPETNGYSGYERLISRTRVPSPR